MLLIYPAGVEPDYHAGLDGKGDTGIYENVACYDVIVARCGSGGVRGDQVGDSGIGANRGNRT